MRTMRSYRFAWMLLALLPLLAGCFLMGARPTQVPLIETFTPEATETAVAAAVETATATPQETVTPQAATPSPTLTPTPPPPATATPTAEPGWDLTESGQAIVVDLPAAGESVGNPVLVRGRARQWPFEGTLVIRVYDSLDQLAAEVPIIAEGDLEGPATFEHKVTYGGVPGAGRIEVLDFSAVDGSVLAQATVPVRLSGFAGGGYIELPEPQSDVTLPIKLLARVGQPDQQVNVRVRWDDVVDGGQSFEHVFTTLRGLDGRGLLIVPLDVIVEGFRHPPTGDAHIEIHSLEGSPLAVQPVRILHPDDPGTVAIRVYWVRNEALAPQTLHIPRTPAIARAALEALIWGPVPQNPAGFTTFIPTPEQILTYPGRDAHYGERVRIQRLTIENGVAYADFSLELGAYSGGALPSVLIREQIKETLRQFSTVNDAVVTVNGVSGVLEP
jgi:hypothetical protein